MWRLIGKLPRKATVAISGGADSVAILHFLAKDGKRDIEAAMFDHGTGMQEKTASIVKELCDSLNVPLHIGVIEQEKPTRKSQEEFWRDARYEWLEKFDTVVTGHNLDDVMETYLMGCCHGVPKIIPYRRNNVVRPFMAVSHEEFVSYCEKNNLRYYDDPSNKDERFDRTKVRYGLKKEVENINQGFRSMMKRKVLSSYSSVG